MKPEPDRLPSITRRARACASGVLIVAILGSGVGPERRPSVAAPAPAQPPDRAVSEFDGHPFDLPAPLAHNLLVLPLFAAAGRGR